MERGHGVATITFGTSGWRAIVAETFTFSNVRIAVAAIAVYLKKNGNDKRGILVAGDYRFLSEEFMKTTIQVLAAFDIPIYVCPVGTPTPAVSYEVVRRQLAGSINFTASHNPYQYQGLKFNDHDGGPAPVETTRILEQEVEYMLKSGSSIPEISYEEAVKKDNVVFIDPKPEYFKRIRELVDFDAIRKAHLHVIVDSMHGNGMGYLDQLLEESGTIVKSLHANRDPFFGHIHPEPGKDQLKDAIELLKSWPAHLITANDGDADRFGIVDGQGYYLTPNQVLAIVLQHLIQTRKWRGSVVRSISTTRLLDAIAAKSFLPVRETPVGFKYIAEVMRQEEILVGGEESGGLTVYQHVPEKDGILACLLMVEVVAKAGRNLGIILQSLFQEYGPYYQDRINIQVGPNEKQQIEDQLKNHAPHEWAGLKVREVQTRDGYRFLLDQEATLLIRFSGTEPLVRCYLETRDAQQLEMLQKELKSFFSIL
jgi:alpha-D-glucose phosphate-specific phosphoglucomutase